jgi:4-hydroxybenzoate polyprenyltransferase
MYWFKLMRWQNLLIVFLTQVLAWACVILPLKSLTGATLLLNPLNFLCIALATVLIAAAGYIINDYFDIKIDIINRPEKVILEKKIPLKQAILMHSFLNVVGLLLALFVALQAHHWPWVFFQLTCTVLLWFYSTHFKRMFMSGNVIVALLTAFTIIVLIWYEPVLRSYATQSAMIDMNGQRMPNPFWVLMIYTFFAFMLTWMREIVKDMEDFKGDAEQGCVTMPIKWGLQKSQWFAQGLGIIAIIPLINGAYKLITAGWWMLGSYAMLALVLPLIAWIYNLKKEATTQHYAKASKHIKIIMVLGIFSLVIYYFEAHV